MNPDSIPKSGGPAFPESGARGKAVGGEGMSMRDYFAAKAMQGLVAGCDVDNITNMHAAAEWSYSMADAMLKAREGK